MTPSLLVIRKGASAHTSPVLTPGPRGRHPPHPRPPPPLMFSSIPLPPFLGPSSTTLPLSLCLIPSLSSVFLFSNAPVFLGLKRKTPPAWMLPTEHPLSKDCRAVLAAYISSPLLTPSLVVSFSYYTGLLRSRYSLTMAEYDLFSAFILLNLSLLEIFPLVDGTCFSSREFLFLM